MKYIKGNFADSRVFTNIDDWNTRALEWLGRTGNKNVHNTIKKRPVEVFLLEKQHLQPVSPLLSKESICADIIPRTVNKDNTIRFQSNRYSVPVGTYRSQPDNQVFLEIQGEDVNVLVIRKQPDGDIIAEHQISFEKGKLIKNRNHTRDRSKGIEELKRSVISHFKDQEAAHMYVNEICLKYARYRRDQLAILKMVMKEDSEWINLALQKCIDEKLYSANDFRDVVSYLKKSNDEMIWISEEKICIPTSEIQVEVPIRSLDTYTSILGGPDQ